MKLLNTLTQTLNTSFGSLKTLKLELAKVNEQIKSLEIKAAIYSERDWEVTKECDSQIRTLNFKYLDLDHRIQVLEKQVTSPDFVCSLSTSVMTKSINS